MHSEFEGHARRSGGVISGLGDEGDRYGEWHQEGSARSGWHAKLFRDSGERDEYIFTEILRPNCQTSSF